MPLESSRNQTGASERPSRQVRFNVVVTSEPPWYVALCLENSVASQGHSVEKALANLKEALELYYEDDESGDRITRKGGYCEAIRSHKNPSF